MNQDTLQNKSQAQTCCQVGHEDQKILGYCLNQNCFKESAFCAKCIITDGAIIHQDHHEQYCLTYIDVNSFLEIAIGKYDEEVLGFKGLHTQFQKIQSLIKKHCFHKSTNFINKLSTIFLKINAAHKNVVQRKELLEQLQKQLSQKQYELANKNVNLIKKTYCNQQLSGIFKRIDKLLQQKQNQYNCENQIKNILKLNQQAALLFFNRGEVVWEKALLEKAIEFYDLALKRNPEFIPSILKKATTLDDLGVLEEAKELYQQVIKFNPKNVEGLIAKGKLLEFENKYQEAIILYDLAILKNDQYDVYYYKAIATYRSVQQNPQYYDYAIQWFDKCIRMNSMDINILLLKAEILKLQGKYKEAISCYDKIQRLNPGHPQYEKAQLLEQLGKYQDAINCLDEVLRHHPDLIEGYRWKYNPSMKQFS